MVRRSCVVLLGILTLWAVACQSTRHTRQSCADVLMANREVAAWMEHFFGGNIRLTALGSQSFDLIHPIAKVDPATLHEAMPNSNRTWLLEPDLPFIFSADGEGVRLEYGDPDSFVDLINSTTGNVYRVVSIGSGGLVLSTFWLDATRFGVLFASSTSDTGDLDETHVACYDIRAARSDAYAAQPSRKINLALVESYVIKLHGTKTK